MKVDEKAMQLYVVTDRTWLDGEPLSKKVEEAIMGGATFVQIREKDITEEDFICISKDVKTVTDRHKIPFVINDNVDVAVAVNADGVHIGQSDNNIMYARKLLGHEKIIGVSVQTVNQALTAEKNGADYLGVGAIFKTDTKSNADDVSIETLKEICSAVSIPVVAIGGITKENVSKLSGTGVNGIAVISAVFKEKNVKKATGELLELSEKFLIN